jgi:glycosyltransferase involved in cell wall biosynthesis
MLEGTEYMAVRPWGLSDAPATPVVDEPGFLASIDQSDYAPTSGGAVALPPRVLHVVEATLGGVRAVLEAIFSVTAGYENGLIYSLERADEQFPDFLSRLRRAGWSLFEVPMMRSINPRADLHALRLIRRVIVDYRPAIVHCHSSKAGALGRIANCGLAGKRARALYSPHALALRLGPQYRVIEWLLGRAVTDGIVAVSDSERSEIESSRVVRADRIHVVPPAIDGDAFCPQDSRKARLRLDLPPNGPLVLGIGRLTYQKDPESFIHIIASARREFPDLRAIWVGEGELRGRIEELAKELGIYDILRLVGWQSDVRPFLGAADVILNCSRYESFGIATAEGLAMGIPFVATRVTGFVDLIQDGFSGLLFPVGDKAAGHDALVHLLNNPAKGRAMGMAGREFIIRAFSRATMHQSLAGIYGETTRQNNNGFQQFRPTGSNRRSLATTQRTSGL